MPTLTPRPRHAHRAQRAQRGIALLEALIASIILAIGLVGAVAMQARAVSALSDAGLRAEATLATNKLAGIMHTDSANLADYTLAAGTAPSQRLTPWYQETRAAIPGAAVTIAQTPAGGSSTRVDVTISWQRKAGDAANTHQVTLYLAQSI